MIIKLLTLVPDNTKIDFFGHRFFAYAVTGIVILASLFYTATKGLNFGIDFTGGTIIEVQVPTEQPDLAALRTLLNGLELGDISLQEFGEADDLLVRMPEQAGGPDAQQAAIDKVKEAINGHYGEGAEFRRTEFVGPQVGDELKKDGLLAILFSIIGIVAYISFRFEWQYGVGAIVALIHDVVGTVGLFAVTQMPFDLSTVAAILMVAGYSVNDTIIVFDRMRENLRKFKKMPMPEVINLSINQTLGRTVMTSGTTLMVLVALWLFGGEVIQGFVVALFFGIAIGTHSSIFVAPPLLNRLNLRRISNGGSEDVAEGEAETV